MANEIYKEKQPVQVVNDYLKAFGEGNVEKMVNLLDANVVWHIDGDPKVSTVGILKGRNQVKKWLEDFPNNFSPLDFSIKNIINHGNNVLVLGRFRHSVISTGNKIGSDMIIHFKATAEKIIRYQIFENSHLLSKSFSNGDEFQFQEIRINGTLYRYRDVGIGPTIIFAHGLFANNEIFRSQVKILSKSFRCIVMDMPGHGLSEHNPNGWDLNDLSNDFALMIEELSLGKVTFIGQSQGGMIGILLSAHYPQLLSNLILIGTSAREENSERLQKWYEYREIILNGTEQDRNNLFKEIQRAINQQEWLNLNYEEAERERKIMLSHNRLGLALALDAAVLKRINIIPLLPNVLVPTLVICGKEDKATPMNLSQEIADKIPNSFLVILSKTGHHPPTEAADEVTSEVETFLYKTLKLSK